MTGLSGHDLPMAASCGSTDCCRTDVPGATPFRAGSDGSETQDRTDPGTVRPARPLSCAQCGNDETAIVRAVKLGMQLCAWDTYAENLAATAARESWMAANPGEDWHVRRYGE